MVEKQEDVQIKSFLGPLGGLFSVENAAIDLVRLGIVRGSTGMTPKNLLIYLFFDQVPSNNEFYLDWSKPEMIFLSKI